MDHWHVMAQMKKEHLQVVESMTMSPKINSSISFDRQAACRWLLLQIVEQVLPYTNGEEQFNCAFDHLNQVIQATKTKETHSEAPAPAMFCTFQPCLIPLLCHGRRKTSAKNTPGYPPSELLLAHLLEMHFRNWDRREHRTPGSISGSQARGWTREEAQKIEK